jgi:N utilization substance protein B
MAVKLTSRHQARILALQALYSWFMTDLAPEEVEIQIIETVQNKNNIDLSFFKLLFRGVVEHADECDQLITPHLDRELISITPIERCILRIGAYELFHQINTPFQIILNESIELNKSFGATEAFKYINGVLDQLATAIRPDEVAAYKNKKHPRRK